MEVFYAIILGIIQALTEFLPISSSGHLVIVRAILAFEIADPQAFDVSLHVGSLLALIIYFSQELQSYIKGFFSVLQTGKRETFSQKIPIFLLIAMMPAIIIGGLVGDVFIFFQQPVLIAIFLIIGGILFLFTEKYIKTSKELKDLTVWDALYIGLLQVLAFIPGVSRSGITIIAGMWRKFNRFDAAKFTFILAIPVLFAAGVKKAFDIWVSQNLFAWDIFVWGMLSSAIASYFVIAFFMKFVQKHTLSFFGWYRIILGLGILAFIFLT